MPRRRSSISHCGSHGRANQPAQLRPVPDIAHKYPELADRVTYLDTFGIDSPYDYDPVWAKAIELKMAIGSHAGAQGFTDRNSISTYIYNL